MTLPAHPLDLTGWIEECQQEWGYDRLRFVDRATLPQYLNSARYQAGIIDPALVAKTALINAASVAGLMLTTDCMVAEVVEEKAAGGMPDMGGMGGMGGMGM